MLLFSILLFPVMESSTVVVSEHGYRPQTSAAEILSISFVIVKA
jgi:hypothetical protein